MNNKKYLEINMIKDLSHRYTENYKTLLTDMKDMKGEINLF